MSLSRKQLRAAASALRSSLDVLRRPLPTTASDWADHNFFMSAESSYIEGKWNTRPYQRVPLNLMGNDEVQELDILKSARVGYTKLLMASVAYQTVHKKRNQIIYQPTDTAAGDFMRDHVQPMIRDVRPVKSLASWFGKKHPNNTKHSKTFDNRRQLWALGGTSAKNYREKSVDTIYIDELDGFDENIEGEGRPDHLANKRTEGSYFRKMICGSTPTTEAKSLISSRALSANCFLRCHIPCPHCSHYQHLVFGNMHCQVPKDHKTVEYGCEECGAFFTFRESQEQQSDCYWKDVDTGVNTSDGLEFFDKDGDLIETPRHVALHIWSAYSPMTTWADIMRDFFARKDNPAELQTWVNQTRGEVWAERGDAPDWKQLYDRTRGAEFELNKISDWVALITCGVDVQRNRLELEIVGWGEGRSQSIDYRVYMGDTSDLGAQGPWEELRALIRGGTWKHSSGAVIPVSITAIDSGDQTQTVYTFCREFTQPQVIPIKGSATLTTLIGVPKPVDITQHGRKIKRGVMMWPVGSSLLKSEVYSLLKMERPTKESGDPLPPGWCDFPEYGEDYFKGLCSEQLMRKKNRAGYTVYVWEKLVERNEPLDCRNYARAAAAVKGIDRWNEDNWRDLRESLGVLRPEKNDSDTYTRNGVEFRRSTFWNK
ncbi:MAG: phage terminase large subunit GpA-like protein [Halioglobus sp.]|jgi:phage terminase large subunit GpA-like protein